MRKEHYRSPEIMANHLSQERQSQRDSETEVSKAWIDRGFIPEVYSAMRWKERGRVLKLF